MTTPYRLRVHRTRGPSSPPHSLLLTILASLLAVSVSKKASATVGVSLWDSAHIPWLNPINLRQQVPDEFNSLSRLLKRQAMGTTPGQRFVSVFVFNQGVTRWALNCIYSYIKFGKARSYIVAATDEASLQVCLQYRLPCYNASYVLGSQGSALSNQTLPIKSQQYLEMVWGKVLVMQEVLKLGCNVHFSDVDAVYLRPVWPSYKMLFGRHRVDAVFMKESVVKEELQQQIESAAAPDKAQVSLADADGSEQAVAGGRDAMVLTAPINLFNTGIYAIKSNNATLKLVGKWLASRGEAAGNDQEVLNAMAYKDYVVCSGPAQCLAARAAQWATVFRHPSQFGALGVCPNKFDAPCDPIRLFLHAICRSGWGDGETSKGRVLQKYRLWLVGPSGQPLYNEDVEATTHPFLPCSGAAWESMHAAV